MNTLLYDCIHQLYERCVLDCCILFSPGGTILAAEMQEWLVAESYEKLTSLAAALQLASTLLVQQISLGKTEEVGICLTNLPNLPDMRFYVFLRPIGDKAILLSVIGADIIERKWGLIKEDTNYAIGYLDQLLRGSPPQGLLWPTDK